MESFEVLPFTQKLKRVKLIVHRLPGDDEDRIWEVRLARPTKLNALDEDFWVEIPQCFDYLSELGSCRCVLLTADGPVFCAGIDLNYAANQISLNNPEALGVDPARIANKLMKFIQFLQEAFNSIERCKKPVLACIHGPCYGAGVDMICACDIRMCCEEATFAVKEVDVGLAADLGTLQRLPKVVTNDSWVREICYTGRTFSASEAITYGMVSSVVENNETLKAEAMKIASHIASKSPVAVMSTKGALNFSRDHTTKDGLFLQSVWNAAMLQSQDIITAFLKSSAKDEKDMGKFPKL